MVENVVNKSSPDAAEKKKDPLITHVLSEFVSGTLTITVNSFPLAKIDGESKTLDVEVKGFRESGLHLGELLQIGDSKKGFLEKIKQSNSFAQSLHEDGWKVRVFEGDESLLTMGRGVSPLTGFMWLNPLKLPKIMSLI